MHHIQIKHKLYYSIYNKSSICINQLWDKSVPFQWKYNIQSILHTDMNAHMNAADINLQSFLSSLQEMWMLEFLIYRFWVEYHFNKYVSLFSSLSFYIIGPPEGIVCLLAVRLSSQSIRTQHDTVLLHSYRLRSFLFFSLITLCSVWRRSVPQPLNLQQKQWFIIF